MDNRSNQAQRGRKASICDKNKKGKKKKKPKKVPDGLIKTDKIQRSSSTDGDDVSDTGGGGTGWDSDASRQISENTIPKPVNNSVRKTPSTREDISGISGPNSLRWEREMADEQAEEARIEQYKTDRIKRYLSAKNKTYKGWLAEGEDLTASDVPSDKQYLPDVVTSSVSGLQN